MRLPLIAFFAALLLACPARSEQAAALLFAEGVFDGVADGQAMAYARVRRGDRLPDEIADGRITIVAGQAADGTRSLSMTVDGGERPREIVDFPASGGNPVLMLFLESAVRSMAAMTGGSPHYIRNRIKDALRRGGNSTSVHEAFAGGTIPAQQVTLHPFQADPNRARMGPFADLSLRFVISDAAPGRFLRLAADTPGEGAGYHETITLTDAGDGR